MDSTRLVLSDSSLGSDLFCTNFSQLALSNFTHLFATPRLGFRRWKDEDLPIFAEMNSDPETMYFFPKLLTKEESKAMMERMNKLYEEKGYCYFAVDLLKTGELIGMIGLGWKTFEAHFTPCVDIGWRIRKTYWNQGLTTEGAQACLEFAKQKNIPEILSMATVENIPSIRVMQKIGLDFWTNFDHPDLKSTPHIQTCSLYRIKF